jgi:hypothetical protein
MKKSRQVMLVAAWPRRRRARAELGLSAMKTSVSTTPNSNGFLHRIGERMVGQRMQGTLPIAQLHIGVSSIRPLRLAVVAANFISDLLDLVRPQDFSHRPRFSAQMRKALRSINYLSTRGICRCQLSVRIDELLFAVTCADGGATPS